jgi:hypothetical protein
MEELFDGLKEWLQELNGYGSEYSGYFNDWSLQVRELEDGWTATLDCPWQWMHVMGEDSKHSAVDAIYRLASNTLLFECDELRHKLRACESELDKLKQTISKNALSSKRYEALAEAVAKSDKAYHSLVAQVGVNAATLVMERDAAIEERDRAVARCAEVEAASDLLMQTLRPSVQSVVPEGHSSGPHPVSVTVRFTDDRLDDERWDDQSDG